MLPVMCPHCGGRMELDDCRTLVPFTCPYCGGSLIPTLEGKAIFLKAASSPLCTETKLPDSEGFNVDAEVSAAIEEKDPKKRYAKLCAALEKNPNSFSANEALLYHGNLHNPMGKHGIDYSAFPCYMLNLFEEPGSYNDARRSAVLEKLLNGEQLKKTRALSPNIDAFMDEYLERLSKEYMDLFIRSKSANTRGFLGFSLSSDSAAQHCSSCVNTMLREISVCSRLTPHQQTVLTESLCKAYLSHFPGMKSLLTVPSK